MELLVIEVSIDRNFGTEPKEVALSFDESLQFPRIILSEQATNDLKDFFNTIFDCIIENEKMIEFKLCDEKSDMFKEVAEDIVTQLNSELKQSEENFEEFIELKNK
ncbi:hypothetical protein LDQ30_002962 [Listeria monocytogenes]|uniref:hypothetical protein n=1 Tax=Listeria welshimeri TaxID=1643 RepID=UPI001887C568|nr:hypothetical protein [Listeria welshimeri]EIE5835689.1 hypothetical protein [Listeria monocytogenes]MBF2483827.1 hypothetical protein [Listeria welshimeri]